MRVRYELSKKQRTAMEAGEPLRLAIPMLANPFYELAMDMLANVDAEMDCFNATVFCSLLNRGGGGERSLQSYFGEIVDTQNLPKMPCYELPVMVIYINGGKAPTRWPAGPVVFEQTE